MGSIKARGLKSFAGAIDEPIKSVNIGLKRVHRRRAAYSHRRQLKSRPGSNDNLISFGRLHSFSPQFLSAE
jgi:hypothetical protein